MSGSVEETHAYRADIDGLRAASVLAVVVFHAFPTALPGGFVGVDVFFVISGFLITGILLGTHESGAFTFRDFYARRIRRIFPALVVVLATSLVLGFRLLVPSDFARLGRHVLAGAAFASNFMLWSEAGYFDALSDDKPLVHLWSLGIEEQFYLVWPLLLWALFRFRMPVRWALAALTAASFATSLVLSKSDPTAAFYAPWSRAWELGAGGLLACYRSGGAGTYLAPRWRNALPVAGLVMIAAAVSLIRPDSVFPGWWATLPVVGACFVIAGDPASVAARVALGNRVMVWVGLISYPLYLWHWVLLSFAHFAVHETPSVNTRLALVAVAVLLSRMTYRFVERPIRFGAFRFREAALAASMCVLAAAGGGIHLWGGLGERIPERARALLTYKYDFEKDARVHQCWITVKDPADGFSPECFRDADDRRPSIFLWGDSHAGRLRPGFERVYGRAFSVSSAARNSTPPGQSAAFDDVIFSKIAELRPNIVVLFATWGSYPPTDVVAVTRRLLAIGVRRVVVLGPPPLWNTDLPKTIYAAWSRGSPNAPLPRRLNTGQRAASVDRDRQMRRWPWPQGVEYVSLVDLLCNREGCYTYVPGSDSDLMTWDYGHLTTPGAVYVATELRLDRQTASGGR